MFLHSETDHIVTLTMDMPERSANVWNQASLDAFAAMLDALEQREDVKGLILHSAKKTFLAGADLDAIEAIAIGGKDAEELHGSAGALSELLRRLELLPFPTVAAINGSALGGGYELCLACNHRVAADSPGLQVGLPEAQLGLLPGGGGTQRLPRMIGIEKSLGLIMEGKRLGAVEALAMGLVDAVVPADELLSAATRWLEKNPAAKQPWDQEGFQIPGGDMDGYGAQVIMVATAMFQAKTHGNYPAGKAILSCFAEGLRLSLDAGLLVEKRYFIQLLLDPVAGAMVRTLFLNLEKANKLAARPKGLPRKAFSKVGVLGAGLMGSGVAYACAKAGMDVVLLDRDETTAKKGKTYSENLLNKRIKRGRSTQAKKQAILGRIHPSAAYSDLSGCQLVVEAVFEDREIKAEVTAKAEAQLDKDALFGSNTSTLPITGLAQASSRPDRFIGLHFFSPVERMPLVEVIVGKQSSDECLAHALDFIQQLGKTPIVVNDARGFYTSRVFGTYITEGLGLLAEGVDPNLIEAAGRASGMPMPPLALADEVGLELMHDVGLQTAKDLGDAYRPNPSTPVLQRMVVEAKRLGRKNQKGFYTYHERKKTLWPELDALFPRATAQPEVEDLAERFLYTQALEAARCVEEGVLPSVADGDVGAILGWGFAPFTGGPFSYMDGLGLKHFVSRATALAAQHGERFQPPALLLEMAAHDRSFHGP
ncbi:MAG: 3-hydroxyacyl-CoA dehydrogenase [Myxococcales bacterium]|nr:3-hydroxyacyl-CoA dehydrogenase [Myxococcales bacterium]